MSGGGKGRCLACLHEMCFRVDAGDSSQGSFD